MSITQNIGINIKTARTERKMTLQDVADRMVQYGANDVTGSKVGAWERCERPVSAENLLYLSMALGVSVYYLYYGDAISETTKRLLREIISRSEREKETLLYSATQWDGNSHALIEWVRMYMSLPREYRLDVSGLAINQYRHLLHENVFKPSLDVDVRFLQQEWEKINRK